MPSPADVLAVDRLFHPEEWREPVIARPKGRRPAARRSRSGVAGAVRRTNHAYRLGAIASGAWLRGREGGYQTAARLHDPYGLRRDYAAEFDGWSAGRHETYAPVQPGPLWSTLR